MLLGASVHALVIEGNVIKLNCNKLLATRTKLGWLLSGSIAHTSSSLNSSLSTCHCSAAERELNETLQNFWKREEAPRKKLLTADENEK